VSPDPLALKRGLETGYRFLAYSLDSVFLRASAERPMEE
jgi:hypothetical protein